jgi:hypothetical protein
MVINIKSLEEEFNLGEAKKKAAELRKRIRNIDDYADPDGNLMSVIERANALLDRIEEEIDGGAFSPRLIEVAAALINSITQASNSLLTNTLSIEGMAHKKGYLELKREELEIKRTQVAGGAGFNQTNNILVSSREDLMKLFRQGVAPPPLESGAVERGEDED